MPSLPSAARARLLLAGAGLLAGASSATTVVASPLLAQQPMPATVGDTVRYAVAFPNAAHHEAEVAVTFPGVPAGEPLRVWMSRSSPGRYALHEFAKNVYDVRATDARGRALRVTRPDPYSWLVHGHDGTVRVTYTLFGDRADGTYAAIDRSQAHLNMPATFMWAEGLERRPITLAIAPQDTSYTVATQLPPTRAPRTFAAPDLQYFMDSPTTVAPHMWREWRESAGGPAQTIRFALHHQGTREEFDRYTGWTQRIVREAAAVYGELPRFDHGAYTFIGAYLPWASGDGMEHRNSTILTAPASLADAAEGLVGTVAHEFFHAWNIERIRPADLEPFDFTRANMSELLWLGEGFTSYYDALLLERAGITPDSAYARGLAGPVNAIALAPGRRFHSPVEMSRQAPFVDAAVSIDPTNRGNTFLSYYTYGEALGLALDLALRQLGAQRGDTTLSLDTYMRELWRAHGKPGIPYTLDDARQALGRTASDTTFANAFWRRYVTGSELPDYPALLATVGVAVLPAFPGRAWAGDLASLDERDGALIVRLPALAGTPLYAAGLDRGDRIVSLAGREVRTRAEADAIVTASRPGATLPIVYESRGRRIEATLPLVQHPAVRTALVEETGARPDAATLARRTRWLRSAVARPSAAR